MPLELAALLREPRVIFGLACLALSLALFGVLLLRRWRDWRRRSRRPDLRARGLDARYHAPRPGRSARAPRPDGPRPYTGGKRRPAAGPAPAAWNRPHRPRTVRRSAAKPLAASALRPYRGGGRRETSAAPRSASLGGYRSGRSRRPGSFRPRPPRGAGGYRGKPFWKR